MERVASIIISVFYLFLIAFLALSILVNRKFFIIQTSRVLFIIYIISQITWYLLSTFYEKAHDSVIYRILPDITKILFIFIHYLIGFHWYEFYHEIRLNRDYGNNLSWKFYLFWFIIFSILFFALSTYVISINLLLYFFNLDFPSSEIYYFLITCALYPLLTFISSVLFTYYAFNVYSHVVILPQTLSQIQRLKYVSFYKFI